MNKVLISHTPYKQNETWRIEKPSVKLRSLANSLGALLATQKKG